MARRQAVHRQGRRSSRTKFYLEEVHPRSRPIFQRVESVRRQTTYTVVFKLKEPFSAVHPAVRCRSRRRSCRSTSTKAPISARTRRTAARSAPGRSSSRSGSAEQHIHLVRNDEYWQEGKPYLDDIYYRVIPDGASARAGARNRARRMLAIPEDIEPFDVPRLKALPHLDMTTKGWEYVAPMSWIDLNLRRRR